MNFPSERLPSKRAGYAVSQSAPQVAGQWKRRGGQPERVNQVL